MRMLTVAMIAVLTAGTLAAIDTEYVPAEQIKGEHWDFEFDFRLPQRIVMTGKDGSTTAYWFVLYTVTNPDKVAHDFAPEAVMYTDVGKVAYDGIYPDVVAEVKKRYKLKELKNSVQIMGPLKAGEDEAQDAIFVFPEVDPKMDNFRIFVTGLSGEFIVRLIPSTEEGKEPKEAVLRKTIQLELDFPGDDIDLNADKVYLVSQQWIWR